MKAKETLKFALRLVSIKQKKELKKIAEGKNNSLNQEINLAINDHILTSQCQPEEKRIYNAHSDGDL